MVIPKLRGAYAILVVSEDEPDTIIAFKAGPPLILGLADNEIFLASDVQAFVEHTNKVVYLNDFDIVKVKGSEYEITDLSGKAVRLPVEQVDIRVATSDKKGFKHYMLKEMFEQPRAVANAINPYLDVDTKKVNFSNIGLDEAASDSAALEKLHKAERIYIIACGTSYYAGLYAKYLIEPLVKIPVDVDVARE